MPPKKRSLSSSRKGKKRSYKRHSKKRVKRTKSRSWKGHSKKRHSRKGLPHTRIRKTGSFSKSTLQSKNAPRKGNFCIEQKFIYPDYAIQIPTADNTSLCNTYAFFCNNNISPYAFGNSGAGTSSQNLFGMSAAGFTTRLAVGPPAGVNTLVFNRFQYAMVYGSSLTVRIRRISDPDNVAYDGFIDFAMTPVTFAEAAQLFTGSSTIDWSPVNEWRGSTASLAWSNCLEQPGTITKRIGNLQGPGPHEITLRMKHNQNYFNTEPNWKANPNYTVANTVASCYLPKTAANQYANYYVLTYYVGGGSATSGGYMPLEIQVDQKWYVHAFEPVPASIVTMEEKKVSAFVHHLNTTRMESLRETKEPVDTLADGLECLSAGSAATGASHPTPPPAIHTSAAGANRKTMISSPAAPAAPPLTRARPLSHFREAV